MTNSFIRRSLSAGIITGLLGVIFFFELSLAFVVLLCLLFVLCTFDEIPRLSQSLIERIVMSVVISIALFLMGVWYVNPLHRWRVLYSIGCAFINDTAAYVGGSLFGYHRIVPKISPNKTWQGLLSSVIILLLLHYLYALYALYPQWWWHAMSVSCVASTGDLTESLLKRRAGIKDTGWLLPGHGGVLDRIDSLIAVVYWNIFLYLVDCC